MKFNVHNIDRAIRWPLGLAIMAFGLAYHSDWYLVGVAISLSGLVGFCPLYFVLGIDTKNGRKAAEARVKTSTHKLTAAH